MLLYKVKDFISIIKVLIILSGEKWNSQKIECALFWKNPENGFGSGIIANCPHVGPRPTRDFPLWKSF